jgi:hypothetical protein
MLPRFKKGGDYYANAQRVLGDIPADLGGQAPVASVAKNPTTTAQRKQRAESLLGSVKENIVEQLLRSALQVPTVPGVFGTTVGFQNPGKLF